MSRKWVKSPNLLYYVCGEFTPQSQTKFITPTVKKAYVLYLAVKFGVGTTAGHHIHVAVDVRDIYMAGSLPLTNKCLSQTLWCGENRRIILPTATFA